LAAPLARQMIKPTQFGLIEAHQVLDVQQIVPILGFSEKFLYTYTKKLPFARPGR